MEWIRNFKIRNMLMFTLGLILMALIVDGVIMYSTISSIKHELHFQRTVVLPHAVSFLRLNTDVIKIQQLFAEVAASRGVYSAGMEEANKYYRQASQETNYLIKEHIKYHKPEMVQLLKAFKSELEKYYTLGSTMVKEYTSQDVAGGENVVKQINTLAKKLSEKLTALANKHIKKSNELSLSVDKSLGFLERISVLLFATIMVVVILSFGVISYILRPIGSINEYIRRLAKMDFTARLEVSGNNEIAEIGKNLVNLNKMINHIKSLIEASRNMTKSTGDISLRLSEMTSRVRESSSRQNNLISQIVDTVNDINSSLSEAEELSSNTYEDVLKTSNSFSNVSSSVEEIFSTVIDNAKKQQTLADELSKLEKTTEQIKNVLHVISDIADQTNLLALNAAIEAARAGEHGRGFSVVADEVRQLAEKTQGSLGEINDTINMVVRSVSEISEKMKKDAENVQTISERVNFITKEMEEAATVMENTVNSTKTAQENFGRVLQENSILLNQIEEVARIADSNAEAMNELEKSAQSLKELIEKLDSEISDIKI